MLGERDGILSAESPDFRSDMLADRGLALSRDIFEHLFLILFEALHEFAHLIVVWS